MKDPLQMRKCVTVVEGLSADYEIGCRMLENNPTGFERAEIERVVEISRIDFLDSNRTQRSYCRRKAPPRRIAEKRTGEPETNSMVTVLIAEGHRAEECRSAKKIKKTGDATADKKDGSRGKCYVCGSEKHFAHKNCGLCRSLEHRTRDCEERGAEKDTTLAEMNVPASSKVGLMAAMVGAAQGEGREEWDSDPSATFYMSHARA